MVLHVMTVAHIEIVKSGTGRELTVSQVTQETSVRCLIIFTTLLLLYIFIYMYKYYE